MDEQDLVTDSIDLKLDEENELVFEVSIQGDGLARPIYRLVCEASGMSLAFNGEASGEQVRVVVPSLQKQLTEGTHNAHLEVIVDNRIFVPLQMSINFKVSTKVVVESVRVTSASTAPKGVEAVSAKVLSSPVKPKVSTNVTPKSAPPAAPAKAQRTLAEVYENQKGKTKSLPVLQNKQPTSADLLRGLLGKKPK